MKEEQDKKDVNRFPQLRSSLTRKREVDDKGGDLLQVLIDAGLKIEAESDRLSLQTKYLKHSSPVTPQEIKLVDAKMAAIKKVESWIEKMLSEQPIIASSAALIWLGHDHYRRNRDNPEWELPDWIVAYWDKEIVPLDLIPLHEDNIRTRLQSCLNFAPTETIQAMTFASVMYEVIFSQPSLFNSIGRLENFFKKILKSWEQLSIKNNDLQGIIEWTNLLYLQKVIGNHSQVYSFILSSLELFFRAPVKDKNALETIISNWPKIVSADEKFFSNYENPHILNSAAREALNDKKLRNQLEIAKKIDYATNFQHTNLSSRLKTYRKIDRLYTARQTVQKPATQPVGFSLSVAELGTLDQLCDDWRLYKQDAVSMCIDHAYNESKKGKKHVKSNTTHFLPPTLARHPIKKTTLRLSPASRQKLTSLTRNLNKHKLANGRVFSATTAFGLAIHLYAHSLRPATISYKGTTTPSDGLPAEQLIKRDKAQPAEKPKRRKRDPGQSHAIRPKAPAETKKLEEPLESGSSRTANQTTQTEAAQEPQPASFDQPATQSHQQPESTEHSQAAPSEQLLHSEPEKSTAEVVDKHSSELPIEEPQSTPAGQPSMPYKQQSVADQPAEEPSMRLQKAGTIPSDDGLEQTQNKVETETVAATPEETQDTKLPEARKGSQQDGINILRAPDGKDIRVERKPPKKPILNNRQN